MVRSPVRRADEAPLTPPEGKTEKELYSGPRESFSLNRISFGGHRHSEIPQSDPDYYPSDAGTGALFRQSSCQLCDCDCDCTSDGLTGCLRRNKQCLFTTVILSLSTIVILLIFRSLSSDHRGIYVDDAIEETEWEYHHHHYNESEDSGRSLVVHDFPSERISIPIIEDSRDPDYGSLFPHLTSVLKLRQEALAKFLKGRGKRETQSLADVIANKKSKYEEVLAELDDIERAMMEYRNHFYKKAHTVFEPFVLTDQTTASYTEGTESYSNEEEDSRGGGVHGVSSEEKEDGGTTTTTTPATIPTTNPTTTTTDTPTRENGKISTGFTVIDDKVFAVETEEPKTTEAPGRMWLYMTRGGSAEPTESPATGLTEKFDSSEREVSSPSSEVTQTEDETNPTKVVNKVTEKVRYLEEKENGQVKSYFTANDYFESSLGNERFGVVEEPKAKDDAIGISLSEAKKKKLQNRKHLLLNSRIVSAASDITFPTAPDESKSVLNAEESLNTTQQLSMTPSAFAQYFFPYQMCFYANSPQGGKPTARESDPKTFKIEPPSFFHIPHTMNDPKKQTSYHFPTQQNFLSFNINNYANHGQSPSHVPPSGGSAYVLPSPQHFAPFLNGVRQPQREPLFCTYVQPPLLQFPTMFGITDVTHPKSQGADYDETPSEKDFLKGKEAACLDNTVSCRDGSMCIPIINWCDNKIHCGDASDEIFCSCRERLALDRICDGYIDCPKGEDEIGCFGCPKTTFSCDTFDESRGCIPISKQCDNFRDCPTGKDESECVALFPSIQSNNTFHVSYTKGFLHRNWRGDWYPICVELNSNVWALEACMEELGSFAGEPEVSYERVSDSYKGPFLVRTEDDRILLQEHCKGHVSTYVKCPEMRCGTRIISEDYAQNRFKRFIESKEGKFEQWWKRVKKDIMAKYNVDDVYWKLAPIEKEKKKIRREETGRVVGGKESEPRAWPWVVALYKNGDFHCGGVILDEKWIMTAAHCVEQYHKNYYEVRCGMLRRFSHSPMEQVRSISEIIVHEKYNKSIMNNDVALLRMNVPLRFNRWVRPGCLPSFSNGDVWGPAPGTRCMATGWGAVREHGYNPDQMREVEVPILPKCRHIEDLEGDEICAGVAEGGKDTCQGDSGGPLLCRDAKSAWYVAGIVSHGEGCARPGEPGAYTRVCLFMDWITANANDFQLPPVKPQTTCPGFRCTSGTRRCISSKWVCNGLTDCLDGEDELNCRDRSLTMGRSVEDNNKLKEGLSSKINSLLFDEESLDKKNVNTHPPVARSLKRVTEITSYVVKSSEVYDGVDGGKVVDVTVLDGSDTDVETDPHIMDYPPERMTEIVEYPEKIVEIAVTERMKSRDQDVEESEQENSVGYIRDYNPFNMSTENMFQCRKIIQTVKSSYRCDGITDCEDGTDETHCTCRDRLMKTRPGLICDGRNDCEDLSDETGCNSCSRKEFSCRRSRQCLPKFKRCDGMKDCTFGEDEEDCYALAKQGKISLGQNGKPLLRFVGTLMSNRGDSWSPVCQDNDALKMAVRACSSFGSRGYDSFENGTDSTPSCRTLRLACSRRLTNDVEFYRTGRNSFYWPWHGYIYSDGRKICSGAIIESNWMIIAAHCAKHFSLQRNHVVAKLGSKNDIDEAFEFGTQVIRIDNALPVHNSDMVLLRLSKSPRVTWNVRPISLPFWFDVSSRNDLCVAQGEETVFLRSVPNCQESYRCFSRVDESESCRIIHRHKAWTGVIACQSDIGWYPAAVFHESNAFCGHEIYTYLNILERIKGIKSILGMQVEAAPEVKCDGARCREGKCVERSRVCDGKADCPAGEDESLRVCSGKNRLRRGCETSEMKCGNGGCISKKLFGNGVDDCGDGSDEPDGLNCYHYLNMTSPGLICDGKANCLDKSDEKPGMCPCAPSKFKCSSSGDVCVPSDFVCDGAEDCPNGEDEKACVGYKRMNLEENKNDVEVIHMSYGTWHSLCSPDISKEQTDSICKELGYESSSGTYRRNQTRIVPVLDPFTTVKLNSRTSMVLRGDRPFAGAEEDGHCEVFRVVCQ